MQRSNNQKQHWLERKGVPIGKSSTCRPPNWYFGATLNTKLTVDYKIIRFKHYLYYTCKSSKPVESRWYWLQINVTTSWSLASDGNVCLCTWPDGLLIYVNWKTLSNLQCHKYVICDLHVWKLQTSFSHDIASHLKWTSAIADCAKVHLQ